MKGCIKGSGGAVGNFGGSGTGAVRRSPYICWRRSSLEIELELTASSALSDIMAARAHKSPGVGGNCPTDVSQDRMPIQISHARRN
jgi:hypothetical protein